MFKKLVQKPNGLIFAKVDLRKKIRFITKNVKIFQNPLEKRIQMNYNI